MNDYFGGVQTGKRKKNFTGRKMDSCEYLIPIVDFPPPPTQLLGKLRLCVLPRDIRPVLSKTQITISGAPDLVEYRYSH